MPDPNRITISTDKFGLLPAQRSNVDNMPDAWTFETSHHLCKVKWSTNLFDDYFFWHARFDIVSATKLTFTQNQPYLGFVLVLDTEVTYQFQGLPKVNLDENHLDLIYVPKLQIDYHLEVGSYTIVGINMDSSFLSKWGVSLKATEKLHTAIFGITPYRHNSNPLHISTQIASLIPHIINADFQVDINKKYIEIKTLELILLTFQRTIMDAYETKIKESDKKLLHEVHAYIMSNIGKPGTIKQLAHKFGLNAFKLKSQFKLLFGSSIYALLLRERMQKAMHLVANSDKPIAEIAHICGYNNVSAFSAAFKKNFGCPPTKIRN
tara:strand:- start:336 stop:1301 length:966 start_codon:yes stop_codon:yes gene_type:complete